MKQLVLMLVLCTGLLFSGCNKQRREVVISYANGEPQKVEYCHYEGNNRVVTKVVYYYMNGNLESEYELKDGKKEGKQVFYYKNGEKRLEETYANGMLNGKSVQYYMTGQKSYEASYKDDIPHGEWIYYDENENVYLIQKFENGQLVE